MIRSASSSQTSHGGVLPPRPAIDGAPAHDQPGTTTLAPSAAPMPMKPRRLILPVVLVISSIPSRSKTIVLET